MKIKIRLVKSLIGQKPQHRKTAKALGLGKIDSTVLKVKSPPILGMVRAIAHLVEVEEMVERG